MVSHKCSVFEFCWEGAALFQSLFYLHTWGFLGKRGAGILHSRRLKGTLAKVPIYIYPTVTLYARRTYTRVYILFFKLIGSLYTCEPNGYSLVLVQMMLGFSVQIDEIVCAP